CHQRAKNGHPAHQTTGADSSSSTQGCTATSSKCHRTMASAATIAVSGSVRQNRCAKSTYSGFGPSSSVGTTGSRAMPQIGQLPGCDCRISWCIGQVLMVKSGAGG